MFIFGLITLFGAFGRSYISLFLPLFFIAFVVFLILILKEYSTKKLLIIFLLIAVYWLIIAIPFPECGSWGKWGSHSQKCTCIGIEKGVWGVMDAGWSQCVGIPIDYQCRERSPTTGQIEEVPCYNK